jgi:hypothetical protein
MGFGHPIVGEQKHLVAIQMVTKKCISVAI